MEAVIVTMQAAGLGAVGGAAAAVVGSAVGEAFSSALGWVCSPAAPAPAEEARMGCPASCADGAPVAACVGASLGGTGVLAAAGAAGCAPPSGACWAGLAAGAGTAGLCASATDRATVVVRRRSDGAILQEVVPPHVRTALRLMYGWRGGRAVSVAVRDRLRQKTAQAEAYYDSPASAAGIARFVAAYGIDMSEAERPDPKAYSSFNDFFTRRLRKGARPVHQEAPEGAAPFVSPADARTLAFSSVPDAQRLWIKGTGFSMEGLLGARAYAAAHPRLGVAPAVLLSRLAPQDYHRFHSPCAGRVVAVERISGEYFTVNPIAVRSGIDVLSANARLVILVDTPHHGLVVLVAVGATMVGSIRVGVQAGDELTPGDDIGCFAFGGSTVVTLAAANAVQWDEDLLQSSSREGGALETLVRQGERVGISQGGPSSHQDCEGG
eukprot:TRINITY_DN1530_c0_g1_i1.p1 TRINITY_DN1530_c0_g1~~TRINITY_DN1530_c0_g1_i1.p1  ORF type:complete len:438 (+),score=92.23 TRINITY_DN1530_c0_g1_i1:93-1406(+)